MTQNWVSKVWEFLRQDVAAKHFKNGTVVSVEAFPDRDQIVRHRLRLPPQATGESAGNIRTDAARMRLAYDDDKGQPVESWVSAVIVVRTIPTGGRGAAYDWHAINILFFRAPKASSMPMTSCSSSWPAPFAPSRNGRNGATASLPVCTRRSTKNWRSKGR